MMGDYINGMQGPSNFWKQLNPLVHEQGSQEGVLITALYWEEITKGAYGSEDWILALRCHNPSGTSSSVRAVGQIFAMHPK